MLKHESIYMTTAVNVKALVVDDDGIFFYFSIELLLLLSRAYRDAGRIFAATLSSARIFV